MHFGLFQHVWTVVAISMEENENIGLSPSCIISTTIRDETRDFFPIKLHSLGENSRNRTNTLIKKNRYVHFSSRYAHILVLLASWRRRRQAAHLAKCPELCC